MLRPRVLVARDDVLTRATAALDRVRGATGALIVIEGPAGIGKTALTQRLIDHAAAAGMHVLTGAARELEADLPFALIADVLTLDPHSDDEARARLGALVRGEGSLDATARRWQIFDGVVSMVEDLAAEPTLLVIEDFHWVDPDSAGLVVRLAGVLADAPLALLVTVRPDPQPEPVAIALRELERSGAVNLRLEPLGDDAVTELARSVLGADPDADLRAALGRAGGNPLYVLEVLEALADDGALTLSDGIATLSGDSLPPSLGLTIIRRLSSLPEQTVAVLRHAAVLGETAGIERLAAMTGQARNEVYAQLEPAFRSGLLSREDDAVRFRHALIRDALYDDLPATVRRTLHGTAADVLAQEGAPAGQIAVHLGRCLGERDTASALRLLHVAGTVVDVAPARAATYARQVLGALPAAHTDRLRARTLLAQAAARTGDPGDAEDLVRDLDNAGLDDETRLELWHTVTVARHMRGEFSAEDLERYLRLVKDTGLDGDQRWQHVALIGFAERWWRPEQADQRAEEVLTNATDDAARALALATITVTGFLQGQASRSVRASVDAVEVVRRGGLEATWIGVEAHAAAGFLAAVDPSRRDDASVAMTHAIEVAEDAGLLYALPRLHIELARGAAFQGDFDAAVAYAETALRAMDETGYGDQADSALGLLALIAVERGQHDLIADYRSQVAEHAPMGDRQEPVSSRARRALRRGEAASVWDDVQTHLKWFLEETPHPFRVSMWALPHVETALAVGERGVAESVVAALESMCADAPPGLAVASTGRAAIERSVVAARAAIEAGRLTAVWPVRLDALRVGGEVLAENGERDEAIAVLKEGRRLAAAAGATVIVAQYDALLRALGVRRGAVGGQSRPDHGWDALTEAELRVVELVADGLTYRDIGGHLFISRRTVETHVANARRKLNAANRNELTTAYLTRPDG